MSRKVLLLLGCLGFLALCLTSQGCHRKVPRSSTEVQRIDQSKEPERVVSPPPVRYKSAADREVYASWYDVPIMSLAKKRAGLEELTAAHNRLPIGTLVRVTHLTNGKAVLVRITDRGITNRKIKLDLCKEAARELDMVREGVARVRMQVVTEEQHGGVAAESHTSGP
jgi:rare lipoprotein A